jgi:hypothetical protein
MSKRAERRHHKRRMKQKAMRIVRDTYDYRGTTRGKLTAYFVKNADNLKTCGKSCFGNPRRHSEGATYEERIGDREIADGMNDYCIFAGSWANGKTSLWQSEECEFDSR